MFPIRIMHELTSENILDYLRRRTDVRLGPAPRAELLGWGVSNAVFRIATDDSAGGDIVIKQARTQLRTRAPWFSRLERIYREADVLRELEQVLPAGAVPHILFEDRADYVLAMSAIDRSHVVWKQALLAGQVDLAVADRLGEYLGMVHRRTWHRADLADRLGDTAIFAELRVDPFYRYLARARPEAAPALARLIQDMETHRECLVLADFSPKNILLVASQVILVDFETGHYGDPAFDLGFFLSHLLLKTVKHAPRFEEYAELTRRFWARYRRELAAEPDRLGAIAVNALVTRTWPHLAGCMWSRLDATSPIDYLPEEPARDAVRRYCRALLRDSPADWEAGLQLLKREVVSSGGA